MLLLVAAVLAPLVLARHPRVAIVGAGIGGSSAAYFMHEALPDAHIDVFEKDSAVGGRVQSGEAERIH